MSTIEAGADSASADTLPTNAERIAALRARPVLRIAEVTTLTQASRSTIVRAIAAGDLPAKKVGRAVYLPTDSTLAFFGVGIAS